MASKPTILCMDLEGVLVPEIWIAFSKKTGISQLSLTTRDISDYDQLMKMRMQILRENGLKLKDIQDVIDTLDPLDGALEFVRWARSTLPFVILSDTFYEFAMPLMRKLENPTLFCNSLMIDNEGFIADYRLRKKDGKREAVMAFYELGFHTIATGDSYNDVTMLKEADVGILFHAPEKIWSQYPEFPPFDEYGYLKEYIVKAMG